MNEPPIRAVRVVSGYHDGDDVLLKLDIRIESVWIESPSEHILGWVQEALKEWCEKRFPKQESKSEFPS